MPERSATVASTGTSDWLYAYMQVPHRIDVDVPGTVSAISYTIETTGESDGVAKTLKKPSAVDDDWTMTGAMAIGVEGNAYFRLNIASKTGTGDVVISIRELYPC